MRIIDWMPIFIRISIDRRLQWFHQFVITYNCTYYLGGSSTIIFNIIIKSEMLRRPRKRYSQAIMEYPKRFYNTPISASADLNVDFRVVYARLADTVYAALRSIYEMEMGNCGGEEGGRCPIIRGKITKIKFSE